MTWHRYSASGAATASTNFDSWIWEGGISGAPLIRDCAARVEGPIINRMSAGDHEAFLIAVRGGGSGPRQGSFMLSDASDFNPGHPLICHAGPAGPSSIFF